MRGLASDSARRSSSPRDRRRSRSISISPPLRSPNKSKVILLARAYIASAVGHHQIAAESLLKITEIQHKPATVATIVSLNERAGDIDGANVIFSSATKWWSNAMTEDNKLNVIMQEVASFKLKHGKKDETTRLYKELVKIYGSIKALVRLILKIMCLERWIDTKRLLILSKPGASTGVVPTAATLMSDGGGAAL